MPWRSESAAPRPEEGSYHKKIDDKISISPRESQRLVQTKKGLIIVDVRAASEFRMGSLKGALNVPFIDILDGHHTLPKDQPILLICSMGGRSYAAGQILLERGYHNIYNLDGGLSAWKKERLGGNFQAIP